MSEIESFRENTRAWLEASCPASMRWGAGTVSSSFADELAWGGKKQTYPNPDVKLWLDRMASRGWTAPTWPKDCGGGGLSKEEAKVLGEEMRRIRAKPPLIGFGLTMIGPLLLQYGTDAQRHRFLPEICRGEVRWCQGYSEPGAGSDLAGLQTRGVRDGDHWILNGQKVWTSYADKADWMFVLVRTEFDKPKHEGITFMLIDMDQPGVTVKPIKLISGYSPFCETFLEDARAENAHVVGGVGNGWTMAKALLGHERSMISEAFNESEDKNELVKAARSYVGDDANGRLRDGVLRDRITQLTMDKTCLELTLRRTKEAAKLGQQPGPESSIFKYYATELNKDRTALLVGILGPQALGWDGEGFDSTELDATRAWLRARGNSIEGGTSEVQLNIIAKRVLGLPD
ncbi:MAG TPA: acyl-CoA dehydrogenase family protein [Candidatus Limnocylindrales bacterium]|nr:acyl-CoA dehydrogenase family protein [Candidatus Limnocylindrales bacterium]